MKSITYVVYVIAGILVSLILYTLYAIPVVSAHLFGQPPFFKVNGDYANLYPVPVSSLYNFDLPQDLTPSNYLLNQPISFELDKARLPTPADIVAKTKFSWDFGDGERGEGLTNTHTYKKIGSYILKIYADDGTTPAPQILESALINILPDQNYSLLKSRILVNGKGSEDPLTDIIFVDLSKPVELDGTKTEGKGKLEYFWDFGDQKSAFGSTQTHTYSDKNQPQIFVSLRVKDESGFLSDSFVEVEAASAATRPAAKTSANKNQLPLTLAVIFGVLVLAFMARLWLQAQRRGKRQ